MAHRPLSWRLPDDCYDRNVVVSGLTASATLFGQADFGLHKPRRHSADHLRAIRERLFGVEHVGRAGPALRQDFGVLAYEYAHCELSFLLNAAIATP